MNKTQEQLTNAREQYVYQFGVEPKYADVVEKTKTTYGYASRVVTPIRDLDAVGEELEYIYSINDDGKDIMSIQVIPLFLSKEYPALPSAYCISYIYRYLKGSID